MCPEHPGKVAGGLGRPSGAPSVVFRFFPCLAARRPHCPCFTWFWACACGCVCVRAPAMPRSHVDVARDQVWVVVSLYQGFGPPEEGWVGKSPRVRRHSARSYFGALSACRWRLVLRGGMAPQKRTAAAAQRAPRRGSLPASIAAWNPVDPQLTLAQQRDVADQGRTQAKQGRELKRQPTDVQVERAIRDNFKGWSAAAIDGRVVEGLTLRARLARDKRLARDEPGKHPPMGKLYFQRLRQMYGGEADMERLCVKDNSQPVGEKLREALHKARGGNPQRGDLITWLQTADICNQRELVGMLRVGCDLKPWLGGQHQTCGVEMLRYMVRANIATTFGDEFTHFRPMADKILVQALTSMKANGISLQAFWDLYRPLAHCVVSVTDVDALLLVRDTWLPHTKMLESVVNSSDLGERMFSFAILQSLGTRLQAIIDEEIGKFPGEEITPVAVATCISTINSRVKDMPKIDRLSGPRSVQVKYRGVDVVVDVSSIYDEVQIRVTAHVKSLAVIPAKGGEPGALAPIFCEGDLRPADRRTDVSVHKEVCRVWNICRASLNGMLPAEMHTSSAYVNDLLSTKYEIAIQMDPTFKVEVQFFRLMAGKVGGELLQTEVLSVMPAKVGQHCPSECLERLDKVRASSRFSFCQADYQASVSLVYELVHIDH